jgi:hypothetical protein
MGIDLFIAKTHLQSVTLAKMDIFQQVNLIFAQVAVPSTTLNCNVETLKNRQLP